jgi:Tol biopolymer transport system component
LFAAVAAMVTIGSTLPTGPVEAKVPGTNGLILVLRHDPALDDTVLYAVNPDGTHLHRVIPGPPTPTECPHWSPDGSLIAACGAGAAVIIDPDTGASHVIPSPDPSLNIICPVWSTDAQRLACGNFDLADDPSRDGLYTVRSSDGSDLKRLTSNSGGYDEPGDYSPDGKQIVFLRSDPTRPSIASQAHFVVNVDGSGLHRISPWSDSSDAINQSDGSWSPDGSMILYGNRRNLFVVHPDGTGLTQITLPTTGPSFPFGPSWSPDGTRILFGLGTANNPEGVFTANPDGSDLQRVTTTPTFDEGGDWGPHPLSK